jgi:hypothetical protein
MPGLGTLIAQAETRTTFEWARLAGFTEWWQKPLLIALCLLVVAFVIYMYRRDSVELRPGVGVVLAVLRLLAFGGLLVNFLDLQKRTERLVVQNSQVALLVDTSASMSRADSDGASSVPQSPVRMDQVAEALDKSSLLAELRRTHDVLVYRFDQELVRLATLPKDQEPENEERKKGAVEDSVGANKPIDWKAILTPRGMESRYGQSLRQSLNDLRGTPLAGVVLVGDFAENAGLKADIAVQSAIDAKIPVYTIAIGSNRVPVNAGIADFRVPPRAYPGDKFQVEAVLQGSGMEGRTVIVELVSRVAEEKSDAEVGSIDATEVVRMGKNNEQQVVKFELPGIKETGKRTMTVRLRDIKDDNNPTDNQVSSDLEIVERKNTVLLFAGGPTREYQFLRNQLKRDRDTVVDVYLQTGLEGISQDARKILDAFPSTMEELGQYDAIVAFDPDWRELVSVNDEGDADLSKLELIDDWLYKESGGLIVVAGPVFMDQWIQDKNLAKIRSIYPVEFNPRLLAFDDARYGSTVAWPLEFAREGTEAEFLWLGSAPEQSETNWSDFDGVFGFYQVKGPKPGAVVYARYGNPDASTTAGKPIYFAEHFWGSGRIFYMGSGEMWRLRSMSDRYFEEFYTKLLRHVSQGRLLRGSRLGSLLLERDRFTQGSTIIVRAQLNDAQHRPLEVADVTVQVSRPDQTTQSVRLTTDKSRPGMYAGQFPALAPGGYQLALAVPGLTEEPLTRRFTVTAPQLEVENPQRNDALANELAQRTGGRRFIGMDMALGITDGKENSLAGMLAKRDQTRKTYETGVRDPIWDENWMRMLLFFIVSVLCLEWIIRRLCKLA